MTLDQDARQAACDLLWNLWGEQGLIDELPADLRPRDRAEAYGVQAFFETKSAEPLYGWKIAATTAAGQAHIHVDGPIAGRLLAEKVCADGAEMTFGDNHMAVVEPEFAFRMGRDSAAARFRLHARRGGRRRRRPASRTGDSRFPLPRLHRFGRRATDRGQCLRA